MNAAQSHASLLLLAVMGVPWLIDRLFTWLEDSAAYAIKLEMSVARAACDVQVAKLRVQKLGESWDEICAQAYVRNIAKGYNTSPSL